MEELKNVLDFIRKNKIVSINEIKTKFHLSDEEMELIIIQLKDLGFFISKEENKCKSCPYFKSCSQGCLKSDL
ncbi:MAG: hypothetical protein CBR30_01375 [Dictyoglomus sp. NZ13-RE01]|nr:MAG: hypothetical protein CBR30_01375 [Dictyoglomus sp. NZ13-RE01]